MSFSSNIQKTATGYESYEIEAAEASLVFPVATRIQEKYGFEAEHLPVFGLDSVWLDLHLKDAKITIGWDNWSGLFVMAMDEKDNPIIREIGCYIECILDELSIIQDEMDKKQDI